MGVHPKTFTLADVSHDTINTDAVYIVTLGFFHFNFDNFSLHCRRVQVLELESVTTSAAHLLRAETLADEALKAGPGGVPEYDLPRLGEGPKGLRLTGSEWRTIRLSLLGLAKLTMVNFPFMLSINR